MLTAIIIIIISSTTVYCDYSTDIVQTINRCKEDNIILFLNDSERKNERCIWNEIIRVIIRICNHYDRDELSHYFIPYIIRFCMIRDKVNLKLQLYIPPIQYQVMNEVKSRCKEYMDKMRYDLSPNKFFILDLDIHCGIINLCHVSYVINRQLNRRLNITQLTCDNYNFIDNT